MKPRYRRKVIPSTKNGTSHAKKPSLRAAGTDVMSHTMETTIDMPLVTIHIANLVSLAKSQRDVESILAEIATHLPRIAESVAHSRMLHPAQAKALAKNGTKAMAMEMDRGIPDECWLEYTEMRDCLLPEGPATCEWQYWKCTGGGDYWIRILPG